MITTYEGPGRARKQCPNGHYVHAKQALCVCGHKFREAKQVVVKTTTYSEAGKGRKQCPSCSKYVGVRSATCPECSFDFANHTSTNVTEDVATYTEGGKGKKKCPACNVYVGCRVKQCVCGHDFDSIPSAPEINVLVSLMDEQEDEPRQLSFRELLGFPNHRTTFTPSGHCPTKLYSTQQTEVLDWIEKVQKHFIAKGEILAPSGFAYFARDFFDIGSTEYNTIKQIIGEYFSSLAA